ncbi:MAG: deoxyribose-phosphate aldolase [Deltaproteobacteria bacterium]|jgi:deoxyribose-phosphate aldolase|nr:deoxyribose-phosphate aldolase [Deltaproteobacteria bacterium]MBW1874492.1 deoxyribose-phosphate aldolase [Deltaproteobacteria bacterium]MBW2209663.1 deoxyribose-phosphate aldolase [Deltaproteobacteria bacterium]MBW2213063.1 deoxyribose-phosphate aldolase [Deltaproteobacteria bacterium]MBW2549981.1 deoxyribose-phosphate aldolase [Deltaproteobacteria bacterium]
MRRDLAALIDHTLLRPDAVRADFARLCKEAIQHSFATVCVNSAHVALCTSLLADRQLPIAATVSFPLGAGNSAGKAAEAAQAVLDGASEIDMVCQIGALKDGLEALFIDDIRRVVDAAEGRPVKVILETCLLSQDEKRRGAQWTRVAGAAFVKTSTGFSDGGATEDDVRLLRAEVGPDFGVKASGGIRDTATADNMIAAGASRLGTSAGVMIVTESKMQGRGY